MIASSKTTQQKADRKSLGKTAFSVSARVAMQLGRESISNSIVAILELIKNSYDADAEHVRIRFAGLNTAAPILVIEDDGVGMTKENLVDHWMVIGTSNKLNANRSPEKQRILTGEKGLGRLGLDRLCQKAFVQSFVKTNSRGIELELDWSKYENNGERLESIEHDLFSIPKIVEDPTTGLSTQIERGTRLLLYGLKETWTLELLANLKQELTLLVSPFSGINDFAISLDSGLNQKEIDGQIGSAEMLTAAEWKVVATIATDGQVSYSMTSALHNKEYSFPPTPWEQAIKGRGTQPTCGPLIFEFYFFARQKIELADLSFNKAQIEKFLQVNQGIRIYRDRFRVMPYGQPNGEGDWLTLSWKRQQSPSGVAQGDKLGFWRVGYNQIVGAVFVSRETNGNLIDQTNREGIVEDVAFFDLRAFASAAIRYFELSREDFERARKKRTNYDEARSKAEESSQKSQEAAKNLRGTAGEIRKLIQSAQRRKAQPDIKKISNLLDTAIKTVDETLASSQEAQIEFIEAAQEREEEFQRQKDTLGNLASLGILTTAFGHETLGSSNVVLNNAHQLKFNLQKGLFMVTPDVRQLVEDNLQIIVTQAERIETFAGFTLRNVSRDKRTRNAIFVNDIAKHIFLAFDKSLSEKNISIDLKNIPEKVRPVLGYQIDWESIFINLITNSVWALQDTKAEQRKIRVSMREAKDYLDILFADSGSGFEAGTIDKIFLPTFSTKRNERGEVVGTGLGLTIAEGFVQAQGGTITPSSPCDLGGAQFHIRIPIPRIADRGRKKEGG
jgi:signal transduction histidine kinase